MQLSREPCHYQLVCAPLVFAAALFSVFCSSPLAYAQTVTDIRPGVKLSSSTPPLPPVSERRLIRLEWSFPSYITVQQMNRSSSGSPVISPGGSASIGNSYDDNDWDYGVTYTYQLSGTTTGFNETTQQYETQPWQGPQVKVTVQKVTATKAQTVDTRIDMRYSTYKLTDHKFGTGLYRGGLFAGFNADNSRVARTYLQFDNLTGPSTAGDRLWPAGGVYLYSTRNAKTNVAASLVARFVANDTWNPTTMIWSNAPTPVSSGVGPTSVAWTTGDPGKWVGLNIVPEIENSLVANGGDGVLSVAITGENETNGGAPAAFPLQANNGWSYFAKANYVEPGKGDLAPFILYAYGGQGTGVSSVFVGGSNPTIHSHDSLTGSVGLSSPAPAGGVSVTLSSSDPAKVTVPSSVTIPAGQTTATFSGTSGSIATSGTVVISATLGKTVTTTLNVAP